MYPLKFKKIFKEKVWGSRKFETLLDMNIPADINIGESWEVSLHGKDISIVENGSFTGKSLEELLNEYKEKLVGKEVFNEFQYNFPLLIKYLDINDRLSVQVHPNDEYAIIHEGELGKSESWYIIEASQDAKIILGLNNNITKDKFLELIKKGDITNSFNVVNVKKGDFIDIEPGLIHASLEGSITICEIQQNSDATYRIYDFNRIVEGELRPLHLDKALDVIDYNKKANISTERSRSNIKLKNANIQVLIKNKYFKIDKIVVEGEYQDFLNLNFKIFSILDGQGEIICNNYREKIKKGETFFVPAELDVKIEGNLEILKSYI